MINKEKQERVITFIKVFSEFDEINHDEYGSCMATDVFCIMKSISSCTVDLLEKNPTKKPLSVFVDNLSVISFYLNLELKGFNKKLFNKANEVPMVIIKEFIFALNAKKDEVKAVNKKLIIDTIHFVQREFNDIDIPMVKDYLLENSNLSYTEIINTLGEVVFKDTTIINTNKNNDTYFDITKAGMYLYLMFMNGTLEKDNIQSMRDNRNYIKHNQL